MCLFPTCFEAAARPNRFEIAYAKHGSSPCVDGSSGKWGLSRRPSTGTLRSVETQSTCDISCGWEWCAASRCRTLGQGYLTNRGRGQQQTGWQQVFERPRSHLCARTQMVKSDQHVDDCTRTQVVRNMVDAAELITVGCDRMVSAISHWTARCCSETQARELEQDYDFETGLNGSKPNHTMIGTFVFCRLTQRVPAVRQ